MTLRLIVTVPLYTHLAPSRVLEHPRRAALLSLIQQEPGIAFSQARQHLNLAPGAMQHHAHILETAGVVFSSQHGQQRRIYPVAGGHVAPTEALATRALERLRASGTAMTNAELARELGVSRQALHYHMRKLVADGALTREHGGRCRASA